MKMFLCVLACLAMLAVTIQGQESPRRLNEICSLPLKVGPCKARMPKYGYVAGEGCVMFIYGGCRGNGNNFPTLEECQAACNDKKK